MQFPAEKRFCFSVGICITPRFLSEKGDRFSLRACPATLIIMVSLKGGKYGKSTVYDFRCILEKFHTISDTARQLSVEPHVLRYWEDELELNIPRNEMGHRYYTQENIKEFQYIKELKEKGYQLKAIKMIVHNGDMEQRLPELTGNEADKPGGVKNHQVYFKNPETLALAEAKQSILDNTDRMAQFTELMTDIVGKAIAANNENLSRTISEDVGEQVLKEMNYLMREREELEEERFRQLDEAIRGNLKKKKTPLLKKWTKKKPSEA